MTSIDYAFHLSFLIRDGFKGLARINKKPHVVLKNAPSRGQDESNATIQTVMSMSPPLFQKEIKKYKIKAPLLHLNTEDEHNKTSYTSDSDESCTKRALMFNLSFLLISRKKRLNKKFLDSISYAALVL